MDEEDREVDDFENYEYEAYMAERQVEFNKLLENRKYGEAYKLVLELPDLLDYTDLTQLAEIYIDLENNLGMKKAERFKEIVLNKVLCLEDIFGVGMIDTGEDLGNYLNKSYTPETKKFLKSMKISGTYANPKRGYGKNL